MLSLPLSNCFAIEAKSYLIAKKNKNNKLYWFYSQKKIKLKCFFNQFDKYKSWLGILG